ncbi:MAG: DUF1565 domain-containing protein, partial [Trueperaceae bacterium]
MPAAGPHGPRPGGAVSGGAVSGGVRPATVALGLLLVAALTACPKVETSTFTLTIVDAVVDAHVAETTAVSLQVNRSGGFAEPVTVTLAAPPAGMSALDLTIAGTNADLTLAVADGAALGTAHLDVVATAGTITRIETLTVHVHDVVARPTGVVVDDGTGGNGRVRQGWGAVTLSVTGTNLGRATAVTLGGIAITQMPGGTDTSLVLEAAVPHGAAIGAHDLVLDAPGGATTFPAALVVDPITAGPSGNDGTGRGTDDDPFRTLTYALSIAEAGDTVRLHAGEYATTAGEQWPQLTGGTLDPGPNVPDGVTVVGAGTGATVLQGPAAPTTAVALAFDGDGGASLLTVSGFAVGIHVTLGQVGVEEAALGGNDVGLFASGGSVTSMLSTYIGNRVGMVLQGGAEASVEGGASNGNAEDGVQVGEGTPTLTAVGFATSANLGNGVAATGFAEVALTDHRSSGNGMHGLEATDAAVEIRSSRLDGNGTDGTGSAGIWSTGGSLLLRATQIDGNADFGIYVQGEPTRVDLGSFTETGNNDVFGNGPNGSGDQLLDVRPARIQPG